MADDLGSWLARLVVQHDAKHGGDLTQQVRPRRYCQVVEFRTYRTEQDPHAQIVGVMSDQTHHVLVAFDVNATDEFEKPRAGLPSESLTSHLRAIFLIKDCRIRLIPRPPPNGTRHGSRPPSRGQSIGPSHSTSVVEKKPEQDIPIVVLEITDWDVVSGDRNDPVFWDRTEEIGLGRDDAGVQKVLRKWWAGESYSDPSQHLASHPAGAEDGRSKPRSPTRDDHSPSPHFISFADFLEPYLHPSQGKKPKPIPEWIFEVSPETRVELNAITMFGLDVVSDQSAECSTSHQAADDVQASSAGDHTSHQNEMNPSWSDETGRAVLDELPLSSLPLADGSGIFSTTAQPDPPTLRSTFDSSAVPRSPPTRSQIRSRDEKDEDEESVPIRPAVGRDKGKKRAVWDSMGFPSPSKGSASPWRDSSPPRAGDGGTDQGGETDEDELSSYEREQRRTWKVTQRKKAVSGDGTEVRLVDQAEEGNNDEELDDFKVHVAISDPTGLPADKGQQARLLSEAQRSHSVSQSLSASQRSTDFTLSRFIPRLQAGGADIRSGVSRGGASSAQAGKSHLDEADADSTDWQLRRSGSQLQAVPEHPAARTETEGGSKTLRRLSESALQDCKRAVTPPRASPVESVSRKSFAASSEKRVWASPSDSLCADAADPADQRSPSPSKWRRDGTQMQQGHEPERSQAHSTPSTGRSALSYLNPLNMFRSASRPAHAQSQASAAGEGALGERRGVVRRAEEEHGSPRPSKRARPEEQAERTGSVFALFTGWRRPSIGKDGEGEDENEAGEVEEKRELEEVERHEQQQSAHEMMVKVGQEELMDVDAEQDQEVVDEDGARSWDGEDESDELEDEGESGDEMEPDRHGRGDEDTKIKKERPESPDAVYDNPTGRRDGVRTGYGQSSPAGSGGMDENVEIKIEHHNAEEILRGVASNAIRRPERDNQDGRQHSVQGKSSPRTPIALRLDSTLAAQPRRSNHNRVVSTQLIEDPTRGARDESTGIKPRGAYAPASPRPTTPSCSSASPKGGYKAEATAQRREVSSVAKLGGWRPDLIVDDGLREDWVGMMTTIARDLRARARPRGRKSLFG